MPAFKIKKIKNIKQGLNNDISIIQINQDKKKYILKKYKNDKRDRLHRELYFLNFTKKNNIVNVPKVYFFSKKNNFIILERINGLYLKKINKDYILNFSKFIKNINKNRDKYKKIYASDHFKNLSDLKKNVTRRVNNNYILNKNNPDNLKVKKIIKEIKKKWDIVKNKKTKLNFKDIFSNSNLMISTSDFGPKNVIIKNKSFNYIDFEYSGLDFSIKYVCDFLSHPDLQINTNLSRYFLEKNMYLFKDVSLLQKKIEYFLPFFYIKWSCIILNNYINKFDELTNNTRKKLINKIIILLNKI